MRNKYLFLAALFVSACASDSLPTKSKEETVTIVVAVDGTLQPGVTVFAVMSNGTRSQAGVTGASGGLTLDISALRSTGAVCLLFEKEGFFTSAIWLEGYEFTDPEYIALAKFALP